MSWKKLSLLLTASLIWLVSCSSGPSTVEKMYEHMEEAVSLEQSFADQQQPLVELEQQEKDIYQQVINLGLEEIDQVKELSEQAITIINERAELIETEEASITAAKDEFDKIQPLIEEIEEEEVKTQAEELYQTMEDRYQAYTALNEAYVASLELDKQLYEMLQREDLTEEELTTHIDSINSSYEEVIAANEQFNAKTDEYNNMKEQFYSQAGLDVEYSEAE
ncbi:YkyA family protein [Radiobacillus sp. PE A8.2]|uniref:YkyA family protein n=1 Tax=Radiobacillus sp. PE A8.2 TaxID=3380349 RepID=UPI003890F44C